MFGIIRKYNQNKREIWTMIVLIVVILIAIRLLNNYYKNNKSVIEEVELSKTSSDVSYSVISQENISEQVNKSITQIIDEFIKYCNSHKTEEAYEILSTDCKKELYSTIEDFEEDYCKKIFSENKLYSLQAWNQLEGKYTYKVLLKDNFLKTGKISDEYNIEEYYTCVYENGQYRLNINNYIGEEKIQKEIKSNGITFKITNKNIYKDYEKYNIEITNKTGSLIYLDSKNSTNKLYIKDENDVRYFATLHELNNNDLEVLNGQTKNVKIKFNKSFGSETKIEKMLFRDITVISKEKEVLEIEIDI